MYEMRIKITFLFITKYGKQVSMEW